jgi:hypothetical protein
VSNKGSFLQRKATTSVFEVSGVARHWFRLILMN